MDEPFDKHRQRRVIFNDDSDQQYPGYDGYPYDVKDDQSFLDARTTHTFDTHVDTYVWCVGNGCEPPWAGQSKVWPALGTNARATDLIVQACHDKGIEVWGSLRMNDIHDASAASLADTADPLKAKHPEYLIASAADRKLPSEVIEKRLWTAFNYARPEVRRYRLDYVQKTAARHNFDGFELDFTRMPWCFPLGEGRTHANEMTQLIRQIRTALNRIAERRRRPYTLVVHVFDSPQVSLDLGLDTAAWLKQELVDVLVVGTGYTPYNARVDEWLALARPFGVPVYPSVNTNTFIDWSREWGRTLYHEAVAASSAYYGQTGVDGCYLFNLFCLEDKSLGGLPASYVYAPLKVVGDPKVLAEKDKLYCIQPSVGYYVHALSPAPLPIAIDQEERKLPLQIGPDGDHPKAHFHLRARLSRQADDLRIWMRLNQKLLPEVTRNDHWCEADLPRALLRAGENELSIWSNVPLSQTDRPIILHQVYVMATYES